MPVPSGNLGAQGGMRVIYDVSDPPPTVTLLMTYFHREKADVTRDEVKRARENTRDVLEAELVRAGLRRPKRRRP